MEIEPFINCFSENQAEVILKFCSFIKEHSAILTSPIQIEDVELYLSFDENNKLLSLQFVDNSFDPQRTDFSYNIQFSKYMELIKEKFHNIPSLSYNCTKHLQMSQFNLYSFLDDNNRPHLERFTLKYYDYALFIKFSLSSIKTNYKQQLQEIIDEVSNKFITIYLIITLDEKTFEASKEVFEIDKVFCGEKKGILDLEAYNCTLLFCKKIEENNDNKFLSEKFNSDEWAQAFIVNKEGRTVKTAKFKIKSKIRKIIKQIKYFEEELQPITQKDINLLNQLSQIGKNFQQLKYIYQFEYTFKLKAGVSKECNKLIPKHLSDVYIQCELFPREIETINTLLKQYKDYNIEVDMTEMQQFSLDFSSLIERKCANPPCYTVITKSSPFYYCYWCKIFYCEKCVEDTFKRETDNLREKYLHKQHNLLYITTTEKEYLTDLTLKHLGKNRFAQVSDNELTLYAETLCNGCAEDIVLVPRYLCVTCRAGKVLGGGFNDYCYTCMEHMRNNDEKGKAMQLKDIIYENELLPNYNAIERKHSHKNHIYLLIITKGGMSYYDY